jgi:hypothetical protein
MLPQSPNGGPRSDPRFKLLASAVKAAGNPGAKAAAKLVVKVAAKRAVKAVVPSNVANPGHPAKAGVIRVKADVIRARARVILGNRAVSSPVNRAVTTARSSRALLNRIRIAPRPPNQRKRPAVSWVG